MRSFWMMACLAVWAAMRPKLRGVTSISIRSPSFRFLPGNLAWASSRDISSSRLRTKSTTWMLANALISNVLRSIATRRSRTRPMLLRPATCKADSTSWASVSRSSLRSRSMYSNTASNSLFIFQTSSPCGGKARPSANSRYAKEWENPLSQNRQSCIDAGETRRFASGRQSANMGKLIYNPPGGPLRRSSEVMRRFRALCMIIN